MLKHLTFSCHPLGSKEGGKQAGTAGEADEGHVDIGFKVDFGRWKDWF